jgi:hypothetical protein
VKRPKTTAAIVRLLREEARLRVVAADLMEKEMRLLLEYADKLDALADADLAEPVRH